MSSAMLAGAVTKGLASPNDTVRVACVGVRGQGGAHLSNYGKMQNVQVAAICDVDENIINKRLADLDKAGKAKPKTFTDFRQLLEDKDIDAVSIATPNHHHTWMTIAALQAGKDVYIEKPCSHNIYESQQIVKAASKYSKQVVQHGVNARSSPALQEAAKHIKDGLIGDVYMARGLCYKWRDTIGRKPVAPVPAGVNYDLWLGPAPKREFTENRFHYNWHWFWDYGNGDIGNQGIHEVDIARWMLGVKYPTKVSAIGGHFMFDDDQETPNTLTAIYEFRDAAGKQKMMNFEVRHWMSNHEAGIDDRKGSSNTVGNIWYGSKGYLAVEGYNKYQSWLGKGQEPGPSGNQGGNNWQNFIDVVRSRKKEDQNNPIEEGAISCTLMHLANISYRVGRSLEFDSQTMTVKGDPEANKLFTRAYRKGFEVPKQV